MYIPKWNITELSGYVPKTTFWEDFSIADMFGVSAITDTFKRAFEECKSDHIYLTELVMVLNHKIWQWYDNDEDKSNEYNRLWEIADGYACDNLKGDELRYFYETTD